MRKHCYYCDNRMTNHDTRNRSTPKTQITRDHIIPQSSDMFQRLSHRQHIANIVDSCHGCNNRKGDTPPLDWLENVCKRNQSDYMVRLTVLGVSTV